MTNVCYDTYRCSKRISTEVKSMKNGGIDRRIIKTRKAIRTAFKELVQQKDMSEITISELTKRANITRSTFYMYYDTVDGVRAEIENEIIDNIGQKIGGEEIYKCLTNPYPLLRIVAEEIALQDENNRYILSSNNSGQLLDKICDHITVSVMNYLISSDIEVTDVGRTRYIVAFAAAGTMECFKLWFNHKSTLTLEELCIRIAEILTSTLPFLRSL